MSLKKVDNMYYFAFDLKSWDYILNSTIIIIIYIQTNTVTTPS